ncbi:hypothetical protein [Mumia sp. ZJ430]|uniref:hypothetical protein n=1 Tax=Mumia sp. ZJ430 TaxID=2708083 RepID=UPI0014204831|nr:hypothetical protein [Mumia sp. ZJ430]
MSETREPTPAPLDLRDDVVWPLVAIALAVLPFWVFGGSSSTTTVNGEVVSEQSLNLLGLLLAALAIGIGVKRLRMRGGNPVVRRSLAAVAIVAGLVQLPISAGLWSL